MAETYYDSDLSGEELDAALRKAKSIDQYVLQAQSAASTAESHAQSAGLAEASATSSAKAAESAKTAAQESESHASQYASQVQEQVNAAKQSADSAEQSATQAAASVEGIADDVIQSAANAQKAADSANSASADAKRAEDAADRAEQVADFDPSQFATAEQGAKADTALQPSALDPYALKSEIPMDPEAIGAATAAQGAKADSAVQPDDLGSYALKSEIPSKPSDIGAATAEQGERADTALQASDLSSYAKKTDIPSSLPNPQSLTIQLNGYTQATYNGSQAKSVNITPSSIGAATSAQGALADSAIQSSDLTSYARKSDIPSELPNPQSLTIRLGQYGSSTTYDGNYSRSLTITPSDIGAGDMSKSTYDPQGKNQDVFAYCPHLYKATFRVNSWSGYTGNYSQNVYVTAVDGGPSITSSSVMVSGLFCDDTVQGDAQDELLEAAAIVDRGTKTFGSGTMTCSISGDKPTADAEVYFMARKG